MSLGRTCHRGLSLLEVMIATSILAGSAMVLSSLIGTGAKFGNRAEARMTAIIQAHSILDESLARIAAGNVFEEISGETGGLAPRTFRVAVTEIEDVSNSAVTSPSDRKPTTVPMLQVEVSLFNDSTAETNVDASPLVRLVKLVRRPEVLPVENSVGLPSKRDQSSVPRTNSQRRNSPPTSGPSRQGNRP